MTGQTNNPEFLTTPGAWDTTFNPGTINSWAAKIGRVRLSPEQQIAELQALISGFDIHAGTKNSLLAKLRAASDSHARGNTRATCGPLKALANEAQAQSGKKLSEEQANAITTAVATLRTDLGCT